MGHVLFVASNATAIQFDFATELERLQAAGDVAGAVCCLLDELDELRGFAGLRRQER